MLKYIHYKILSVTLLFCIAGSFFFAAHAQGVEEPYLNELKGAQVADNNTFTVADEKYINPSAWSLINQNITINDIISFEINFDTTIYFYNQPFDCTVNFKIYLYGNQADTSEVTDSTTYSNISLQVRYDTVTGKPYKGIALYKFSGVHKYKVKVISITSPQLSPIPAIFRLKGHIVVNRQYTFNDNSTDVTRYSIVNGNQMQLQWTPSNYPGAEQFDLEYTHIDAASTIADRIRSYQSGSDYFVPADSLNKWFLNNNTRITTAASGYLFNIPYDSGFILFRIRGTQMHYPDGVRWEGNWNYLARELSTTCSTCPSGTVFFDPHESNLNWQYTASFAEEGKRKEVITYFDGTLRNRQAVTINNSDNKNIVQETIYDALGRPAVNILPAPVKDSTLHYFRGFNKNSSGDPYSFADLLYDCATVVDSISSSSGAGRYYSSNNPFLNDYYYAKHIPDAGGYPFAATEYVADNTGRIKAQGGVGPVFQLDSTHATTYFYGKPTQIELDRLFGTEAGNSSHYLKNMVVDPNGQISVSYVNASGKTIATALAGAVPENLHALPSTIGASTQVTDDLIKSEDFLRNASDYSVAASTTFLAPVTGTYVLDYRVDPLRMEKLYGPDKDSVICNNCYYDLEITVKDNCNNVIRQEIRPAGTVFDTTCSTPPAALADTLHADVTKIGEYYVTYRLVISRDAVNFYDSVHLVKNSDIKKLNYFLLDELKQTDFSGCFSNCETCLDALGTKQEFTQRFKAMYTTDSVAYTGSDSLYILSLYDQLLAHCQSIQGQCADNVCDEKLQLLKMDVTPGGQYAPYNDTTGALLEPMINVLARRDEVAFFTDEFGNRDSVIIKNVNGEDSVKLDAKQLNDSLFIIYFKDNWVDSLVRFHPEYCHYLWCTANSNSYEFEREIKNWLDADTAMARGWFSTTAYDTILAHDPFFLPGGNGYDLREKMRDSLRLFSRTFARTSISDKNILQFIDATLYCSKQYDGWNNCSPDSACRSRNREWYLYQQLYLNLKLKFYEEARRTSSDPIFANCVNCYIGKDALGMSGVSVPSDGGAGAYVPFVPGDSTCSYTCADGTYSPFNRSGISVHIQRGNPSTEPSGVPSGYGNCQFFAAYDMKSGTNSSCKFYNVWVCTYDTACGGICEETGTSYSSSCPDDPNAVYYQNKIRRYPEYVNSDSFIDGVLSGNPQQNGDTTQQQMLSECRSTCEAQAEIWINQLRRCTTDSTQLANLKQALIDVCSAGCSVGSISGTSTLPDTMSVTYHSFEEAIIGILGPSAVNDSCTAELLANPYPYNRQPAATENFIAETNYEICQKISQYKTEWQSSGFSGSFHQFLSQKYGSGYKLDSLELDDLLNSCTNCNGILKDEVSLPVMFNPGALPCLLCDSVQAALTAFNAKFPGIGIENQDYETLFANFFNHRFGYSLTYDQYKTYLDSCTANGSYAVRLCNQPITQEAVIDNNGDGCMASLFATALTNANNTYVAYIDSIRRDFRESYMTRCMNVQPVLTMSAELFEYHYTLYYYDQSGSLVKTIPPEGVTLLNSDSLALVKLHRLLQSEGCYQYSDSIHFNNNGQISWKIDSLEANPLTLEMMTNLDAYDDQVLVSKIAEYTYDTGTVFYRHAGLLLKVEDNKLAVEVYAIGQDTIQHSALAKSVLDVGGIIPLNTWTHYVVERTADSTVPIRLWVNGNPVALQFTANDLIDSSTVIFGGTDSLTVGAHDAPHLAMPGKLQGTIKNLRIYNRLLLPAEIRQITYNNCQLPANKNGLVFWSPMNNADTNKVKELVTQQKGILTGFTWEPFAGIFPPHRLPTVYEYNSLGQVLKQYSPDGDTSSFFYDRLGRLTASQNKEQKDTASYSGTAGRFSYTKYDALGRITEVGEKSGPSADIRSINLLDTTAVKNWLASGTDKQVTKTLYDNPVNLSLQASSTSRKRVTASVYLENASDIEGDSTLYSYDINGNVKTLQQYVKALVAIDATNGKKQMDYDYDLVSGKVNLVSYQAGKGDQFFYKYHYDADNRVVRSYSSRDKLLWNEDASYLYYLHGPLARMELGDLKVQGVDYAYTLQGWLKGINSDSLSALYDIANDGKQNTVFSRVSRDVYGMKLGYYNDDYLSIGSTSSFTQHAYTAPSSLEASGNQLFNGNISYSTLALSKIGAGVTTGYTYGYDQLNRLVEMRQHTATDSWSNSDIITAYRESIAYDANGNILKYLRKGTATTPDMDSLAYKYNRDAGGNLVNNKLNYIRDAISSSNYTVDIDDQSSGNYGYDKIGNLIKDNAEGLDTVRWTVYGKINRIKKSGGTFLNYGYDPGGNRTFKQYSSGGSATNTYYVRDAQGNVLAIYEKAGSNALKWSEQHLYGSSRLGMWKWDTIITALGSLPVYDSLLYGSRAYELTNHLGNVLATISDKKIGNDSSGVVNYYLAEALSQNDYYPFGMLQPARQFGILGRYGFNGKENDNEVKGEGGQQDYGMRIYDPRVGRFLSVDPLAKDYPWYTPYQFAGNKPIWAIDLDGMEENTTSTHVYHPPVLFKPAFRGIISFIDATSQKVHKTFEGNFSQLAKFDPSKYSLGIVNALVGNNIGNSGSRLDIAVTGTRSAISKTWKGTDIHYFTQFSYSFTSNNITEKGTFELQSATAQVSARIWDPLAFLLLNKVVSSIVANGVNLPTRLVRVIPEEHASSITLGKPSDLEVFVTTPSELKGLNSADEIAQKLTLKDAKGNLIKGPFRLIEFDAPTEGLAQPFNKNNPGFINGGKTAGGATEYMIPNLKINELKNVTQKTVN